MLDAHTVVCSPPGDEWLCLPYYSCNRDSRQLIDQPRQCRSLGPHPATYYHGHAAQSFCSTTALHSSTMCNTEKGHSWLYRSLASHGKSIAENNSLIELCGAACLQP